MSEEKSIRYFSRKFTPTQSPHFNYFKKTTHQEAIWNQITLCS